MRNRRPENGSQIKSIIAQVIKDKELEARCKKGEEKKLKTKD